MKKIISLLVAVIMIATLAVPTFAATPKATVTMGYSGSTINPSSAGYVLVPLADYNELTDSSKFTNYFTPDINSFTGVRPEQSAILYGEILSGALMDIVDMSKWTNIGGKKIFQLNIDAVSYDKVRSYQEMVYGDDPSTIAIEQYYMKTIMSTGPIVFTTKVTFQSKNFLNPVNVSFDLQVEIRNGQVSTGGSASIKFMSTPADLPTVSPTSSAPIVATYPVEIIGADGKTSTDSADLNVTNYELQAINLTTGNILTAANGGIIPVTYNNGTVDCIAGYKVTYSEKGEYVLSIGKAGASASSMIMLGIGVPAPLVTAPEEDSEPEDKEPEDAEPEDKEPEDAEPEDKDPFVGDGTDEPQIDVPVTGGVADMAAMVAVIAMAAAAAVALKK